MHLARLQVGVVPVAEEAIDNGVDAEATTIWHVIEPGRMMIIDNGHGMLSTMLAADADLLQELWQKKLSGELPADFDVRSQISPASRRSLQWMQESIGFSAKLPDERDTLGTKGLGGTVSWRSVARRAVWTTRPNDELAAAMPDLASPTPVWRMEPPTAEQLARGDLDYSIVEVSPNALQNPYGGVLASGTAVEIMDLDPEAERGLRPMAFAEAYRMRYGGFVRAGRITIIIVDRVTEEGRRTPNGREILVQPSQYRGAVILETEIRVGKYTARIELFYDPKGRGTYPFLRRQGIDLKTTMAVLVSELPLLRGPLISGKLSGFVAFPNAPDTEAPWTTDKLKPLDSPLRSQWERAVASLIPDLEAAMEAMDEKVRSRQMETVTKQVTDAALEAIGDLEAYQGILPNLVRNRTSGKSKSKKKRQPRPLDKVIAVVRNEHNMGVAGAILELHRGITCVNRLVTGPGGVISFGKQPPGRYRMKLTPPNGAKVRAGEDTFVFNLSPNQPGCRIPFHVVTGEPAPQRPGRLPKLELWLHPWENVGEPFRADRLARYGQVEINEQHDAIAEAYRRSDEERVATLTALYTSMALAGHAFHGTPTSVVNAQAASLFNRMLDITLQDMETRQRAQAARRGRK